ncbi:MAG: bis(5'-nucleosyl)-tetraphosphatase [Candidatus Micrarchaeota archaeon]|nr:bis(5'-nucleosyl)-tetraphosphatase [Candidatus Micrarchaeota archaeon]
MQKEKAAKEKSCGAVVFREEKGRRLYLILHYEEGHWDFPKGHVEKGESEEETAKREIFEETGISQLEFLPNYRDSIAYSFARDGKRISKEVVFFAAKTPQTQVALSSEHLGFAWLEYEEAKRRLTYKNAKQVLEKAEALLASLS